jgi:hypothetical protein
VGSEPVAYGLVRMIHTYMDNIHSELSSQCD